MKTIKFLLLIALSVGISTSAEAQILKKLKEAAQRGVEQGVLNTVERKLNKKSEEKTEEALDAVLEGKKKTEPSYGDLPEDENYGLESADPTPDLFEGSDSEVGFKRGVTILYSDDFLNDVIGDFSA